MSQPATEQVALAIWREHFGTEPTKPLDKRGGALDPDGWCMQAAVAALAGKPIPTLSKGQRAPMWVREIAQKVAASTDAGRS